MRVIFCFVTFLLSLELAHAEEFTNFSLASLDQNLSSLKKQNKIPLTLAATQSDSHERLRLSTEDQKDHFRSQQSLSPQREWGDSLSAAGLFISELHRDDHNEVDGLQNIFILLGSYRLHPRYRLGFSLSGESTNVRDEDNRAFISQTELSFEAEDILTQAQHGLDLEAEWELSYTLHDNNRNRYGSDGSQSFRLYPEIRLNEWAGLSSSLRYYYYDLNQYQNDYSWHHRRRVDFAPQFQLTDSLRGSFEAEYNYVVKNNPEFNEEFLEVGPDFRYYLGEGRSLSFQATYELMNSFDGQMFATDAYREATYSIGFFTPIL